MVEISLLGPLEITVDGRPVTIVRRRERRLVAVLALEANRVVSAARLIDLLWTGEPPPSALRSLRSHVSRLRAVLTDSSTDLAACGPGYVLRIDPERVDAHRFRAAVRRAAAASPADRAALLDGALALWRVDGAGSDDLDARLSADLDELRLTAVEDWATAELALGNARALAPRLAEFAGLATDGPPRERLVELRMLALHTAGRTAEALALYDATRAELVGTYGIEPGQALRRTQVAVLRDETAPLVGARPGGTAVPAQLPPPPAVFVGRAAERSAIVEALLAADPSGSVSAVVVALHGQGGVGKSALAVAAAHEVADRFPDGQLYVDLHGATVGLRPLSADDVIGRFLRALGVSHDRVPVTTAEAVALYRTVLAGRRVLVVADNAADAAQVAPLVPAAPGCAVVVTSRPVLAGLDGAVQLALEPLPPVDARLLLGLVAGVSRAMADPRAVAAVASACGNLPLALRIAGARMVGRADWSFADLAGRLADERDVLRELSADGDTLRAGLGLAWAGLTRSDRPDDTLAARVFVALGVLRVPDVEHGLVAAAVSVPPATARRALDRLVEVRLLDAAGGRYRPHDLVRLYSAELAAALPAEERWAVLSAGVNWYRRGAVRSNRLMRGDRFPQSLDDIGPEPVADLADGDAAGRWLDAERANLLAIARQGLAEPTPARCGLAAKLVLALYPAVLARGHAYEWELLCGDLLAAADRLDDPATVARASMYLAVMFRLRNRLDDALTHLDTALRIHRETGDLSGEAGVLEVTGAVWVTRRVPARALPALEAALVLRRRIGDLDGEGVALCNAAEAYFAFGRPERALEYLERSLELRRRCGNLAGEAITLTNLAEVQQVLGRSGDALRSVDEGLERSRSTGQRANEGRGRTLRARLLLAAGRPTEALADCEEALRHVEQGGGVIDVSDVPELLAALRAAGHDQFAAEFDHRLRSLHV